MNQRIKRDSISELTVVALGFAFSGGKESYYYYSVQLYKFRKNDTIVGRWTVKTFLT